MNYNNQKYPLAQLLEKRTGTAIKGDEFSLSYENLRRLTQRVGEQLASLNIGSGDCVAMVTPNGPQAATIFISVASFAIAAPLNPNYTKDEFKFYLKDLDAKILIVQENLPSYAREAAGELGTLILEIRLLQLPGEITLTLENQILQTGTASFNRADDTSLVLHTSGTTSRPKIVPLSADNISVSARNIARTLKLNTEDRYLNIMPLFHIHGLIAGVLTTLESGGEMFCSTGFNALKFFNLLSEVRPTWFSAVPSMHQAILSRAARNQDVIMKNNLKFIRSSSASLPVVVLKDLESVFQCPVIEAYGMTEASHQMASNPLPPLTRKVGTVGIASGPAIKILSNNGEFLSANQLGEIVIKGANVTKGYKNNPEANKENFIDGWFRTGDQGSIDSDGYLSITGRLKEIINRGGEKISPREVDEVLITHPNVAQAVTFSIPHKTLGEDVAAALVLIDEKENTKIDFQDFLKTRLTNFKIPKTIIIVKEIPKGSTGKVQRIGLATQLGLNK